MNAERLHAIVVALNQEMTTTNSVGKLHELINALHQVVNPPQPQSPSSHQQALSQSLKAMYAAVTDTPSDSFSPTWRQILSEIDGEALFGRSLKVAIEAIFAQNQITPAVALAELQQLHKKLQSFKNALDQSSASLKHFKIGDEKLSPGECEIGVLIPRLAVDNKLLSFVGELKELGFILNTFAEISTGNTDDLTIRTISSSDLLVHLQASAPYAACVAVCIERVVTLYKQLLEIRKLHQEIRKQGVPDNETSGIENYANQLMEKGIDKIVIEVVKEYHKKDDKGRKHELTNAVRISLNKIANRIDKGFNYEVRVAPTPKSETEEKEDKELQKAIATIQSATANMQFMKLEGQPILQLPEREEKPKKKE
ncbi:MAG: hypothetical protein HY890_06720 [Deltaproteobacteria bacterium]|nr:hypothetical protein [Deltaproteobacteria bacterium]